MEIFLEPSNLVALFTLTFLEIVLGIDNIIFVSLVTQTLPSKDQRKARNLGLLLALVFRIALLLCITWIIQLTDPLFTLPFSFEEGKTLAFSWRDLILLIGGAFLVAKSTTEIHHKVSVYTGEEAEETGEKRTSFVNVILQIIALDLVFSFDSILTAIGLTEHVGLMIVAVILAMIVMMIFAGRISGFIAKFPTLQILALSFLILIGFTLALDALHVEVPKGYIYFSVFFSLVVELLNLAMRKSNVKKRRHVKK